MEQTELISEIYDSCGDFYGDRKSFKEALEHIKAMLVRYENDEKNFDDCVDIVEGGGIRKPRLCNPKHLETIFGKG